MNENHAKKTLKKRLAFALHSTMFLNLPIHIHSEQNGNILSGQVLREHVICSRSQHRRSKSKSPFVIAISLAERRRCASDVVQTVEQKKSTFMPKRNTIAILSREL
ncbi:hypothetical protein EVAR_45285_1 [Eumeta japonica]|uniref:Uncharacterized protein n=1 Tax=Eumeta variegata TaxID=151549 RepID=A0A4C1Y6V4_EUMVA|nr:hypothetical protein EVAR_45285_1 [Eumeta japonica]